MKKKAFLFLATAAVLLAVACNKTGLERTAPQTAEDYHARGLEYLNNEDYNRAIADFTQAKLLDPDDAYAYRKRGSTYIYKGDYDNAITVYTQAIRLDPNDAEAYHWRGFAYDNKGDYDRAIADYETALQLEPNNSTFELRLENARRARGW